MPKLLVIGLGNVIMGDDGVGVQVIQQIEKFKIEGVDFLEGATSGISLLPHLQGRKKVIIIDAVRGGGQQPGSIYRFSEKDIQRPEFRVFSLHDISLEHVLVLGRKLFEQEFPEQVVIYGVEIEDIKLSDELSHSAKKAVQRLVELLLNELNQSNSGNISVRCF